MTPETSKWLGWTAGLVCLIAYWPYIVAVIRRETIPNRATWIIWTLVSLIIAISYKNSGGEATFWVPVGYAVGSGIVAILSFKYGEGGWTRLDKFCLTMAVLSIPAWILSGSPKTALLISLAVDLLGALPTIKKSYLEPEKENRIAWSLFAVGCFLNVAALPDWNFWVALYPVAMVMLVSVITFPVLFLRKNSHAQT